MTTQQPQGTGDIKTGIYKGRAIDPVKGGYVEQAYGKSKSGIPELLLRVEIPAIGRVLTTPMYFSLEAAPHSVSRLRACGWRGEDLADLTGVDTNEIDVDVSYRVWSQAEGGDGSMKLKVQILSGGGGAFGSSNPTSPREFAANVAAITGKGAGNGSPKPPF
jgi:hypothetical protein